jgi:hypothetical protein
VRLENMSTIQKEVRSYLVSLREYNSDNHECQELLQEDADGTLLPHPSVTPLPHSFVKLYNPELTEGPASRTNNISFVDLMVNAMEDFELLSIITLVNLATQRTELAEISVAPVTAQAFVER